MDTVAAIGNVSKIAVITRARDARNFAMTIVRSTIGSVKSISRVPCFFFLGPFSHRYGRYKKKEYPRGDSEKLPHVGLAYEEERSEKNPVHRNQERGDIYIGNWR